MNVKKKIAIYFDFFIYILFKNDESEKVLSLQ